MGRPHASLLFAVIVAATTAACATAGDRPGTPDAGINVIADAMPGFPDTAPGTPDAIPGTPDAVPGTPDAVPGPPDATPGPPDAGCIDTVVQLLNNADLDLGPSGWVENGAGYPIILSPTDPMFPLPITPHSGNFAAWLGGLDSATRSIHQDVVIPAGATNMAVTGYRYIATEELGGVWDTWTVTIRNTSNTVLQTLGTLTNADAFDGWLLFSYAPGNYAGQTIRLHIENTNDFSNNTNFFTDTLNLRVTVCQ